ncbi:hypothetical protein FGG08_005579 [Glutinoglossum americanum]|uniref:DUF3824 domain-containing protein n=1 Tax=Glutinoglossum americanum TaxID=1670608 RepID=A0A9P8I2Y6_9PEZI|nr:hypothetical protein FGG08_005579 [Glutinoglossum americanum]
MSYVSYGSEVIQAPHHHRYHEHLDRRPGGYVAGETRVVRRGGDADELIARRRQAYVPGAEYLHETAVDDEYRRGRRRRDHDGYGVAVSRGRALSLERGHGRIAGSYYRYGDDPRRSLGAMVRHDVDNEWDRSPRRRSASRNEKLLAGAAGAGVAVAGKEYWDHKQGRPRSPLETAAFGVAGALAGAEAAKYYERSRDHSRGARRATVSEHDTRHPGDHHGRRKSLGEAALAVIGLGEVARHHSSRSRSRSRSHGRSHSHSHNRNHRRDSSGSSSRAHGKMKQAAQAAVAAAVAEAIGSRNEPGSLTTGERGRRIAQAAITAGGLDALVDHDPDHHPKRKIAEAVIGGLAGQRILSGPGRSSRSSSRHRRHSSDGGGHMEKLAKGGLAAAAGKALLNYRNRSKSRDRARSRSSSVGSGRSRSTSRHDSDGQPRSRPSVGRRDTGYPRGGRGNGSDHDSSSDDMSSTDEEKMRRKLRGKELIQAGVATVASIHAAHNLYESMESRKEWQEALQDGEVTHEQARRAKAKGNMKDAASVGLAVYGVHGALKSWEAMKSRHDEKRDFDRERARRQQRKRERAMSVDTDTDSWRRSVSDNSPDRSSTAYSDYGGGPTYHDGNPYGAGGLGPSSSHPPGERR